VNISPKLREYAETPDRYAPVVEGSSVSRFDNGRVCVIQGRTWASVSAPRVAEEEVAALLAETRSLIPAEKLTTWWIGPSSRPADVVERLVRLGLQEPHDRVSRLYSLVRTDEPAGIPAGIEVRPVETYDDFAAAREVQWDAFETLEARRQAQRPGLREDFEESMQLGIPVMFVASLDGRPAATAMSIPSERGVFLIAGAVAPWARGHGLYRALVRARWDDAVERRTPALVTQANPETSYPILRRLGFEEVCEIRRLEDVR
jgi:hypothetical protein